MTRSGGRGRFPWPLFLALRYLRSGRKDAYVSFLSAVAVGGIGLGVGALLVAQAGLSGLQFELRQEVLARTSQLEIEVAPQDAERLAAAIATVEGVESVSRRLRGAGWLLAAGSVRPVQIVGFEGDLPESFPEASTRAPGAYLGGRLAMLHGLQEGSLVEVASARPRLSPLGPLPRMRRLTLAGTFDDGVLAREDVLALPLADASRLLGSGSLHLAVDAGGLTEALHVAGEIGPLLPETARLRTWQDLNAPLLFALRLEKRLMFVAVFLIVMVGALALVSDLSLIIASRRAEIGILGTIGAEPARLRHAFLTLGALLAGLGIALGAFLGVVGSIVLDRLRLIRLPGDAYLLDHVPFRIEGGDVLWVVGATLAVAMLCTWYGASRVGSMRRPRRASIKMKSSLPPSRAGMGIRLMIPRLIESRAMNPKKVAAPCSPACWLIFEMPTGPAMSAASWPVIMR